MKTYVGVDVQIHILLTSVLVGDKWSASRTVGFTPGERAHGTHWIGGCVNTRAGLNNMEKILDRNGARNLIPHSSSS
jgi:hypothetical protein